MHSSLVRLQNVFGFFTTVAFSVGALIALSSLVSPQSPSAKLEMRNVQVVKGRPHYYSTKKEEYAHIKFDLDADLSTLINWNTKSLFVYVKATFPPTSSRSGSTTPYSEAIIWDAIIPSPSLPFHPNTYIHPGTGSSKSRRGSSNADTGPQAYPPGGKPGILKLSNQKPKYQITTPSSKIAGLENCTLSLHYNIQPWVGALVWGAGEGMQGSGGWGFWKGMQGGRSAVFDMPLLKGASAVKKEELRTETGGEANRGSPA